MAKHSASPRRSFFIEMLKHTRLFRERRPRRSAIFRFVKFVHGTLGTAFPTEEIICFDVPHFAAL